MNRMKNKYENVNLNYDLIASKYPNIDEYENIVSVFLNDPFFNELEEYLSSEDYAMAKDATKGLMILSQELYLFPLYEKISEIYEDLEFETYDEVMAHYKDMKETYERLRNAFSS